MTTFSEYLAALDTVAAATAATRRVASQVDFNSLLPGQQVRLVGLSWASVGMRGDVVTIDASSDDGPTFSHGANGWVIYYANEGDDWGAVPVDLCPESTAATSTPRRLLADETPGPVDPLDGNPYDLSESEKHDDVQ